MGIVKKNGSWTLDYRANGRRIREKIGPSKAFAEKVMAKRAAEIAEGKFLDLRREKKHTFAEAAERFLTYSKANKRSFTRDQLSVRKYLLPVFGERYLKDISSWDIEKYKARRKAEVSPASVNRELACLKTIFNKAMQWGLASANPVKGVKFFPEQRRLRFLMRDEITLLLEACPDYFRPMVVAALNSGMRRSELLNLQRDDVDFGRGQILVRDSKNGESRTIEMNAILAETLAELIRKRASDQTRVFLGRSGQPITTVQKVFSTAAAKAGLTNLHFHDLRHTFASHLVMNGVDLTTVKELLGHKSIQMTLRYAHLSQPHKKKAVDTLAGLTDGHFLDTQVPKVANAHFGDGR